MSDNGEELHSIECSLGELRLEVRGCDEEWVRETFREEWDERLSETEQMTVALRDGTRGHQ